MGRRMEKDPIERYKELRNEGIITVLVGIGLVSWAIKDIITKSYNLEQKTQNEIIINSTKVDTTNYQGSFNYLDYNKNKY